MVWAGCARAEREAWLHSVVAQNAARDPARCKVLIRRAQIKIGFQFLRLGKVQILTFVAARFSEKQKNGPCHRGKQFCRGYRQRPGERIEVASLPGLEFITSGEAFEQPDKIGAGVAADVCRIVLQRAWLAAGGQQQPVVQRSQIWNADDE